MVTTSGVHPPPPFLSCPGEPSTDWRAWLTAFDMYLTASGLNAAEVRDEQKGPRYFTVLEWKDSAFSLHLAPARRTRKRERD